jgi:hypothetical protein
MKRLPFEIVLVITLHVGAATVMAQNEPARVWKDASGSFQIRAVLVEQSESSVRLLTEDGRVVNVPIHRLSKADQDFLKDRAAPADNPFAGGAAVFADAKDQEVPAGAVLPANFRAGADAASAGDGLPLPESNPVLNPSTEPAIAPFAPDPLPAAPALPAAVAPVSAVDAYDVINGPVVANPAEGLFLISIGRNKSGSPEETRGRIFAANLVKKTATVVWDHPFAVRVLDHDAKSGRTLIVDQLDQFQRGGELVMVQGLITANAKPLYARTLPGAGKPGFAPQVEWARLLSGKHAAAIMSDVLYVWDLPTARLIYRMDGVSAREPPAFSGNQCYMAVPRSGAVEVVETSTGNVRRSFATGTTLRPGVAFHPNGRLLAACFSNQYQVWDCVTDALVSEATTTDHLGSHPVSWIAPKMFRSALGSAIHLDLGMPVWKYSVSASTEPFLLGDKLVTATTSQNCTLVSVKIPHASADRSAGQLLRSGDAAMLVQPGSPVALAVETTVEGVDAQQIKAAMTAAAEKAGWKVSDRGPITLVAKIGRGKTEQLTFTSFGPGPRVEHKANLTPFTAELEIRQGAAVLWTRSTVNRVVPLLHLKEGETVQEAVKKFEKPDAEFFARLTLPPRIPKPEVSEKVGMSVLKDGQWQDLNLTVGRKP